MQNLGFATAFALSVVSVAAALPACSTTDVDDEDSISSAISTPDVLSRAEEWVDAKLHYCESAYDQPDPDPSCWPDEGIKNGVYVCDDRKSNKHWNPYRSDCAGFVTWAWGIPAHGAAGEPSTGGYVTGDFAPFNTSFSHVIAMDDLEPGDALNKVTNEHIVLFKEWVTPGVTARFLEEPGCSVSTPYAHEFTSDVSVDRYGHVKIDAEGDTRFDPIRYDHAVDTEIDYDAARTVVGTNADGRLEAFYIADNGHIAHVWQAEPGSATWRGNIDLGGDTATSLAVHTDADGRLELFYIGTDENLYHNYQNAPNGSWHGQARLEGKAKQLAVGKNADGRLELFYAGTNNDVFHQYQKTANGDWSAQERLPGLAKQLAVASDHDGALQIAYVGMNDHIYENYENAVNSSDSWHGEEEIGGRAKQLRFSHHADGNLVLFYIGDNNKLFHNYQTSDHHWSGEVALGGEALQIATGVDKDGRLELFYIGTDTKLYRNAQTKADGGWEGQSDLGSYTQSIDGGDNVGGRLEVFELATDGGLYRSYEDAPNGRWVGPDPL
jgi:hypothetical protein